MDLFAGSQYEYDSENKTILLDIFTNPADMLNTTEFLVTLKDKLILDEEYEIYFESITTFRTNVNTNANDIGFLLKFFDLNIQNGCTTSNTKLENKKILIPNSCRTGGETVVSKGKKMNYICSILPARISEIHLSLTNLNGDTIFSANDGRAIIELLCIPKKKKLSEKEKLDLALYEHTSYFDDRNKNLIIDLESTTANPKAPYLTEFSVDLVEPLIIDRQSEIYLDSKIGYEINDKDNINNMALLININEFNIDNGFNLKTDNVITNNLESNKAMIPNENLNNTEINIENFIEDFTGLGTALIADNSNSSTNTGSESGITGSWTVPPNSIISFDLTGLNNSLFDVGSWDEDISNIAGSAGSAFIAGSGTRRSGSGSGQYRTAYITDSNVFVFISNFNSEVTDNGTYSSPHYIGLSGYSGSLFRYFRTKNINNILRNATKITIDYIVGNGSNGGNAPESTDHFGINILSSVGPGIGSTQTPTNPKDYGKRISTFTNDNNFNFLIESGMATGTNIYGYGAGHTNVAEWKRISFCPVGSSLVDTDTTTYPQIHPLPGLGTDDANYLEFISIGTGGQFDYYGIKYIEIETSITTTTIITKPLKSTKYNYISTVNPKIIKNISGTITNLNNQSIVSSDNSRLIMDFLIKPCL